MLDLLLLLATLHGALALPVNITGNGTGALVEGGRRLQLMARLKQMVAGQAPEAAMSMEHEISYQQQVMRCRTASKAAGALTKCVRSIATNPEVHRIYYKKKHACAALEHCNGRGECFLGKCFCGASFSGDRCEIAKERHAECSLRSDSCFRNQKNGRVRVSLERWQRASWAEESWWDSNSGATDDHSKSMIDAFSQYRNVPAHLGHVLELGCGPFTQLKGLLGTRSRKWTLDSVTLADPLLVYESKATHSPFRDGKFKVNGKEYPTTLHRETSGLRIYAATPLPLVCHSSAAPLPIPLPLLCHSSATPLPLLCYSSATPLPT